MVARLFRYSVEDKLITAMEPSTALPEKQTLTRVDAEADAASLNRRRPKIIITHEELGTAAKEIPGTGEFPCAAQLLFVPFSSCCLS